MKNLSPQITSNIHNQKRKIIFLGKEIEIDCDINTIITLSCIENIGWSFYESLKRNNVFFHEKIQKVIDNEYHIWKRNNTIDSIVETN